MLIHVFRDSYYIGKDENVTKNAIKTANVTIPNGKQIKVTNGEVAFVNDEVFGGE